MKHLTRFVEAARLLPAMGLLIVAACAPGSSSEVASMSGWTLSVEGLEAEFNAFHGEGRYDNASRDERTTFAEVLLNRELLLRIARRACPEPDRVCLRRRAVAYEDALVDRLLEEVDREMSISPDEQARTRALFAREAMLTQIVVDPARSAEIREALNAGATFDEMAAEFAIGPTPEDRRPRALSLRVNNSPPVLIHHVFRLDAPAGRIVGPVQLFSLHYLFRVDGFKDLDSSEDPLLAGLIDQLTRSTLVGGRRDGYTDSLRTSTGFALRHENLGIIARVFQAYWDSVGGAPAGSAPPTPLWRFTGDELELPLFDLRGETHSIGEFVRSLDSVEPQSWPLHGGADVGGSVEARLTRWLLRSEAERRGLARSPSFLTEMRLKDEETLLDQFRERNLVPRFNVSEADARAEYEEHPERYSGPERISFGVIVFPEDQGDLAARVRGELVDAGLDAWRTTGSTLADAGSVVRFLPESRAVPKAAAVRNAPWDEKDDWVLDMAPGELSSPIPCRDGIGLVRVHERAPGELKPFEAVADEARDRALDSRVSVEIERLLAQARVEYGAILHADRVP